ncbi:hypothetical protein JNB_19288 [Janibacter sp. HTCC2649]|uniref:hypothetical protein n=1 Tax=Janibacter sp. HTCC2649 TaxID=313589 RepID=UPI0000670F87|nr:hypothetical protein [Janibacter sp. HTCC2649]EAP97646.1 hypothetical protein JNB_19288 [Janibacter sp. HTCC2649]
MSTGDHILGPDTAPTPFSTSEIREGCPSGRTVVVRVEDGDGVRHRLSRFAAADDVGALHERADCEADGTVIGEVAGSHVAWLDLQKHASFPASATVIDNETVSLPVGLEECVRYVVTDAEDVTTFWFSRTRPGMPVKVTFTRGGQVLSTTVMVSDRIVSDRIVSDRVAPNLHEATPRE